MSKGRYRVLLLGNMEKPYVAEAIDEAVRALRDRVDIGHCDLGEPAEDESVEADLGVVFGGDGAILAAARRVAAAGVPLLGVNMGRLGFMAEITSDQLLDSLSQIIENRPDPVERLMLHCELRRKEQVIRRARAVNDVVISREAHSRLVEMALYINSEKVTTYAADGLIVSTPTGSTAHSLAAGGPIVLPDMDALVITPICPHTLSNRPLVIPGSSKVEIEVYSRSVEMALTVDGQVFVRLHNHDRISVARDETRLRLVRATSRTFFETLRTKLRWGGQPYYAKG